MAIQRDKPYFIYSAVLHVGVLLVLVLGFDFSSALPVFENTNQQDVISAVVLGDTAKSRILPKQVVHESKPKPSEPKPEPKPEVKPKQQAKPVEAKPEPVKEAIALKKPIDKKKLAEKKLLESIKQKNLFGQDLLTEIKKQKETQKKQEKKLAQEKLQDNFKKTLQKQSEESLRQQLLNENIKVQGTQTRMSRGEVDKYKALILQAISENWMVPFGVNKRLTCELLIRLAPGGLVLDVQISKSSGDPALDSSARAAVLKASPLPVPRESDAFSAFKHFVLKVKPENIIESGAA